MSAYNVEIFSGSYIPYSGTTNTSLTVEILSSGSYLSQSLISYASPLSSDWGDILSANVVNDIAITAPVGKAYSPSSIWQNDGFSHAPQINETAIYYPVDIRQVNNATAFSVSVTGSHQQANATAFSNTIQDFRQMNNADQLSTTLPNDCRQWNISKLFNVLPFDDRFSSVSANQPPVISVYLASLSNIEADIIYADVYQFEKIVASYASVNASVWRSLSPIDGVPVAKDAEFVLFNSLIVIPSVSFTHFDPTRWRKTYMETRQRPINNTVLSVVTSSNCFASTLPDEIVVRMASIKNSTIQTYDTEPSRRRKIYSFFRQRPK